MKKHTGKPAHRVTSVAHANKQHALHFSRGGLHRSTGTPAGQKISAAKHAEAASGKLGKLAEKQERFYRNVLR